MGSESRIVVNLTRGNVVAERGLIADRPRERMRGLLGRDSLPAGEGLLLQPAPSIHTARMRFAIDVIFLDRNLQVIKLVEGMRPWRTAWCRRSRTTLELAAGEVASRGLEIGDQLVLIDPDANLGFAELLPARGGLPAHDPAEAPATTAPSTRVLLVGPDRRFRAVAAALLTRRGCLVAVSDGAANVADLARREAADVVVLDGGASLAFARRQASQLTAAEPPVGVVIVRDDETDVAESGVIQKWGPFERLFGAIEDSRAAATIQVPSGGAA